MKRPDWYVDPSTMKRECKRCGDEKPRREFSPAGKICTPCKTKSAIASEELRERTKKATLRLAQKMTTMSYNQGLEEEYHL